MALKTKACVVDKILVWQASVGNPLAGRELSTTFDATRTDVVYRGGGWRSGCRFGVRLTSTKGGVSIGATSPRDEGQTLNADCHKRHRTPSSSDSNRRPGKQRSVHTSPKHIFRTTREWLYCMFIIRNTALVLQVSDRSSPTLQSSKMLENDLSIR